MKNLRHLRPPRWPVQLLSFIFANSFILSKWKGFCYPVLNCWACPGANFACPIGALQNASAGAKWSLRADSGIWAVLPLWTLGTLLFFSALFGRMMCGWLCPFGWLQDLVGRLRTKKWKIPSWLAYTRYPVLVGLVFVIPFITGEAWFSKLCPMGALEGGIPQPLIHPELRSMIGTLWYTKMAILAVTLVAMLFWKRPFCAVICPLGAIFSLFHRYSAVRIDYERERCVDCEICVRLCPQGLDPRREVNSHTCIGCLECEKCPYEAINTRPMWAPMPCNGQCPSNQPGGETQ